MKGPPAQPRPRTLWRRFGRRLAITLAILVAGVTVTGVVLYVWAGKKPSWWRTIDPADPHVEKVAQAVESGLSSELTRVREGATASQRAAPWSIAVSAEDASDWLSTRMPEWLVSRGVIKAWPAQVGGVQVDFQDDAVSLGVLIHASGNDVYLTLHIAPRIDEKGQATLLATSAAIGRVPVPAAVIKRALSSAGYIPDDIRENPDTRALIDLLMGTTAVDPVIRLPDGRHVRVVGVDVHNGRLTLTCQTDDEAARSPNAPNTTTP